MSSATVNENKSKLKVFQTILCSPGMSEKCKLVMQLSRQSIFILARLIECGLLSENNPLNDEIISALPEQAGEEMKQIQEEILKKGDLTDFYQRIKTI